jgi:hypothetical protein
LVGNRQNIIFQRMIAVRIFAKAAGFDDDMRDAFFTAFPHQTGHHSGRGEKDGHVRRFGQIGNPRVNMDPADVAFLRTDAVEIAFIADLLVVE